WDEQWLIEIHLEADGPARDQRHADVLPVLVAGVFDQGPTLQERSAVLTVLAAEYEPIARLPHGVFDNIADFHIPLAVALEVQTDDLFLAVVRGGEDFEGPTEFAVDAGIEETQALHLRQRDRTQSLGTEEVELVAVDNVVLAVRLRPGLHAHDDAVHHG